MISGKELSISEILKEMRTLKRVITLLIEKRQLNYVLRFMRAVKVNDVCIQKSKNAKDAMLLNIIKITEEIKVKVMSYNAYKDLAIEKIKEKLETATDKYKIVSKKIQKVKE